jgi:hypothetical protein
MKWIRPLEVMLGVAVVLWVFDIFFLSGSDDGIRKKVRRGEKQLARANG